MGTALDLVAGSGSWLQGTRQYKPGPGTYGVGPDIPRVELKSLKILAQALRHGAVILSNGYAYLEQRRGGGGYKVPNVKAKVVGGKVILGGRGGRGGRTKREIRSRQESS